MRSRFFHLRFCFGLLPGLLLGLGLSPACPASTAAAPRAATDRAVLEHITAYLNGLDNMAGSFLQIDQLGHSSNGRFLMKRPGLMRFDYAPPQTLKVVADGKWLAVQEKPGEKADRYPLKQTPLPIFWGSDPLSAQTRHIASLAVFEGSAEVLLRDPEGGFPGHARLTFDYRGRPGSVRLRSWHVVDAHGQAITVILSDLQRREKIDMKAFRLDEPRRRPHGKF